MNVFFSLTDFFWYTEQNDSPTKFFGITRQKKLVWKSWTNPLKQKLIQYPNLMTHWKVPLPNVWLLWKKIILKYNRDSCPLSFAKNFSITEVFWNTEEFLNETFRQTKFLHRKLWKFLPRPPPSNPKTISTLEILWNTEVFPYKVFGTMRQQSSYRKSWCSLLRH